MYKNESWVQERKEIRDVSNFFSFLHPLKIVCCFKLKSNREFHSITNQEKSILTQAAVSYYNRI